MYEDCCIISISYCTIPIIIKSPHEIVHNHFVHFTLPQKFFFVWKASEHLLTQSNIIVLTVVNNLPFVMLQITTQSSWLRFFFLWAVFVKENAFV
jgi:hypothetical protein